jgi:hypothetical protein
VDQVAFSKKPGSSIYLWNAVKIESPGKLTTEDRGGRRASVEAGRWWHAAGDDVVYVTGRTKNKIAK